uniref:LysM peptidoglycan-binding domain-containing protein n=1 Tax=uncultured Allisonella sp. TaxID=339338 RepID=UPI0025970446|nr:LysM peptidoglycan-binding domain-containing protein [uncultured Allisonella sp.]
MSKKRSIVKSGLMCLALTAVLGSAAAGLMKSHDAPLIEYRAEAQSGDTVWSICRRIVTDKDNLQEVVWRTIEANHIKDPTELQPGQVVIVHVKAIHQEAQK